MHKFILGENPQAPESGGLWIIHLPDPKAIIEAVLQGEKTHAKQAIHIRDFTYKNSDGELEKWQLRLYHYFSTDFNLIDDTAAAAAADALLQKAWHWYAAYLEWEDKNIDEYEQ